MTVVLELKDGTELYVPDTIDPEEGRVETTASEVIEFILNRIPLPIILPLIKLRQTRVDMFSMKLMKSIVIDYNYVSVDPASVAHIRDLDTLIL